MSSFSEKSDSPTEHYEGRGGYKFNAATLRLFRYIAGVMLAGQHGLMQDAGDQNASELLTIERDMLAVLHPPQAGANMITRPAQRRIVGRGLAKNFKV